MTNNLEIKQSYQEDEYWFPYHYIGKFENNHFKHFFLDTWAINYVSTIEFMLERIALSVIPKTQIVDIGCGDGRFSRELALAFPSATVVGIDYSMRAIALALAMNQDIANLKFKSIDITKNHCLDLFDIAVLMEVFEHIPVEDAGNFMEAVRALLKDDGVLYLTVPHENKPLEYKHFQHFSIEKILHYLTPYFYIDEVIPFERISWCRQMMLKVLSNRLFILSNQRLLTLIYKWYKKNLFTCDSELECQRIFVKAVAK